MMVNRRDFPVHRALPTGDGSPGGIGQDLHAQTDAQDRQGTAESTDDGQGMDGVFRPFWPRRNNQSLRFQSGNLIPPNLVAAADLYVASRFRH